MLQNYHKRAYKGKELTSLFIVASSASGNPQRVYHTHISVHSQRLKQFITSHMHKKKRTNTISKNSDNINLYLN